MRKEELRKLRSLPATKEMMQKGRRMYQVRESAGWGNRKYTQNIYEYNFLLRVQNLSGYVKVAVFLLRDMKEDIKTPRYEIFINPKGGEWITRELDEKGEEVRWLTAMLHNLDGVRMYRQVYGQEPKYYLNQDGTHTLNRLKLINDNKQSGIWRLIRWQQEQREEEIKRAEQRETAPWDEEMKLVPKITTGFTEWMRKDVCPETYIIYEYKRGGAKEGYCSRCKKTVPINNPKHGESITCPACKTRAELKASGKIKTLDTSVYWGEIIQKFKGGLVIRRFRQHQVYYNATDYRKPKIHTWEQDRVLIYDDGIINRYEYTVYKNKYLRWCKDKTYEPRRGTWYWAQRVKLYRRNFKMLKDSSILKHSAIDLWEYLPTSVSNYLQVEKGNPAIEMLARLGMFKLAKDIMNARYDRHLLDQEATELAKMLKIDKARLKRLKKMDGNILALRWLQLEKLGNTMWPDEMIKDYAEAGIQSSDLAFQKVPIGFVKSYNYLKKQAGIMGEGLYQAMVTWRDYTYMAEQMKMNVNNEQIAKPKNVKEAHDRLVMIQKSKGLEKQAESLEKKYPKVNKQLQKLKKFEYESGDYCIVAPQKVLDIVKEGVLLGHCVHTCDYYFSRIQTDESYLFFLRKKCSADMPWYTLEVEPSGNIRQKRTTGDRQNPDFDKAIPFLKKWQQYFKDQLTEEEEKLGEKANLLREKGYKELREKGNKVWHGPLAGQLLADVLEADFMEAI